MDHFSKLVTKLGSDKEARQRQYGVEMWIQVKGQGWLGTKV